MPRPILILTAILLALGAIEATAYWWMNPTPTGQGEPVLVYRPGDVKELSVVSGQLLVEEVSQKRNPTAPSTSSIQKSKIKNQQSSISPSSQPSTFDVGRSMFDVRSSVTPLPELYASSAPMLRCSGGQVLHVALNDTAGIHLAFFEWDGTDTGSVLEAFRHMPEACMGSIGLTLVEKRPSRTYVVGSRETGSKRPETRDQSPEVGSQAESPSSRPSTFDLKTFDSSSSSSRPSTFDLETFDSSSPFSNPHLIFDHTVFREGGGSAAHTAPIHAFRAVWVSGVDSADARQGLDGQRFDQLRSIRLKSAFDRFRPAHARVIQGAVRGIPDPDRAWEAFEQTLLADLRME